MTHSNLWTMRDIAQASGATYSMVQHWVGRGLLPTMKILRDPHTYIPGDDIEDILAMARITSQGIPGWGQRKGVEERYGVSSRIIGRWVRQGKIAKLDTYGRPLYSVDWVRGYPGVTTKDMERVFRVVARWEGFVREHPRLLVADRGGGRIGRRGEVFRPLSLSAGAEVAAEVGEHSPATETDPSPAPEPEPTPTPAASGRQCADSRCGHPGTDEIRGIGTFCAVHADEKRKILGIRRSA